MEWEEKSSGTTQNPRRRKKKKKDAQSHPETVLPRSLAHTTSGAARVEVE